MVYEPTGLKSVVKNQTMHFKFRKQGQYSSLITCMIDNSTYKINTVNYNDRRLESILNFKVRKRNYMSN